MEMSFMWKCLWINISTIWIYNSIFVHTFLLYNTPAFFFEMVSGYLLVDALFQSALGSFDILESDGTSWNSKSIIPKADKKLE